MAESKWWTTMIEKHGSREAVNKILKERASKGGKAKVKKGFAVTGKASEAGRKGGSVTKKDRKK